MRKPRAFTMGYVQVTWGTRWRSSNFRGVTEGSDCFSGSRGKDEPNSGAWQGSSLHPPEQSLQSPLFSEAGSGRWACAVGRLAAGEAVEPLGLRAMSTLEITS